MLERTVAAFGDGYVIGGPKLLKRGAHTQGSPES